MDNKNSKQALRTLHDLFGSLTPENQQLFLEEVKELTFRVELQEAAAQVPASGQRCCPYCTSVKIQANGRLKGMQRYICTQCRKNFSDSTGTCVANLKKPELWGKYIRHMMEGHSIRRCAELTGISIQTSFDWRHKVLSSLGTQSPRKFEGITESDDIFFNYSQKGQKELDRPARRRGNDKIGQGVGKDKVAVILTCDRKDHKDMVVAKRGRIRKKDIEQAILDKLDKEAILCTDDHRNYKAFAKDHGILHQTVQARKKQYVRDKVYHVQTANALASSLKKWMMPFNGVSTKYLQNYLNWFMMLQRLKEQQNKVVPFAVAALSSHQAWFIFKNLGNVTYAI